MNEVSRQTWYEEWFKSPFYHKLFNDRNAEKAEAFIHRLITHLQPAHGSEMLQTGCGKGEQSHVLAKLGFNISGIDLSSENIAEAKLTETASLSFYTHDIRLPFWINYFNYAFNLFNSFGYFATRREHDAAMRTIGGGLKPGGILVIDYLNVHFVEEHPVHNEVKQIGSTKYEILSWDDDTHFYKKITITDPTLSQPVSFTEKLAKFSLGDFTDMLSFQSLQVQEVFGDYDLTPYGVRKTPRLIIVARKKNFAPTDKEKRLYSDGRKTDSLT